MINVGRLNFYGKMAIKTGKKIYKKLNQKSIQNYD